MAEEPKPTVGPGYIPIYHVCKEDSSSPSWQDDRCANDRDSGRVWSRIPKSNSVYLCNKNTAWLRLKRGETDQDALARLNRAGAPRRIEALS